MPEPLPDGDKYMEAHLIQNTPEWLELRKSYLGASDCPIVMNLSPWCDPLTLWKRKLGLMPEEKENEAMIRGKEMEYQARKEFEKLTGIKVHPKVVFHSEHKFMMASLDGINETNTKMVELKCPNEETHQMAKAGKYPEYYKAQMMHQLECANLDWMWYMTYRNGEGHLVEVERDQEFIDKMIEAEKDFYRRLKEFDPPPQKHRKLETQEMLRAVDRYTLAKDMLARAEKMEKEARDELLLLSGGDCIEGYGVKVTHYVQKGTVDYAAIPELKGVDLDKYRKPAQLRTRINLGE